ARVSFITCAPSFLMGIIDRAPRQHSLREIVLGAEELTPQVYRDLKAALGCVSVSNRCGPTEVCCDATMYRLPTELDGEAVPIGRPLENYRVYVVGADFEPVAMGVAGELCVAGVGLARGYLNRPGLTAERFVANPFGAPGERMYRTGDRVRWRSDGELEFLGRNDHQVKLRGFRVELGEIESRLREQPGVHEAVVLAHEEAPGDKRLVVYYTTAGTRTVTAEALRAHLAQRLPDYMVPAAYVRLEALPLTPNGKLDRKALPAPDGDAYVVSRYEAPRGPVETAIAGIWCEVLGVDRVGRHDNFFELGGHSLLATRVLSRVREALSVELRLRVLFESQTLQELAEQLEALVRDRQGLRLPPLLPGVRP